MRIAVIIIFTALIIFLMIPAIRYICCKPMDFSRIQNSNDRKEPKTSNTVGHNDVKPKSMTLEEIEIIINKIKFKQIL